MSVHTCPYADIQYAGPCPTTNCPANISHVEDRGDSGCAYLFLKKVELSKVDIAYAFDLPLTQIDQQINRGKRRIELYVLMMQCLQHVRQKNGIQHCPKCQVLRTSAGPCLNAVKCEERASVMRILLQQYPFKVEDAAVRAADVFRLVHFRGEFAGIIKASSVPDAEFRDIVQLRKTKFETLMSLATQV